MKASSRKLKQKIKFLNNFQKITKSISLISAIRFQKNLLIIKKIINNVFYLMEIFQQILTKYPEEINYLTENKYKGLKSDKGKVLIIVVSSDRGLAGAFDQIIFRKTEELITTLSSEEFVIGVLGKRGVNHFIKKFDLIFAYKNFENFLPENLARELLNYLNYLISNSKIKEIYLIRSNLTNTGFYVENIKIFPYNQKMIEDLIKKLIPSMKEWENLQQRKLISVSEEFIFEPQPRLILSTILNNVFYLTLYTLILESQASLELTRTITMRKASDNAQEIKEKNILEYNKMRQQKITEELIDLLRN